MPIIERLPHLLVPGQFQTEKYTALPSGGGDHLLPARDRATHGTTLRQQLDQVRQQNEQARGVTTDPDNPARIIIET